MQNQIFVKVFLVCLRSHRLCKGWPTQRRLGQMVFLWNFAFWHYLGPDLVDVFNEDFSTGRLSVSQHTAFITLFLKRGST